MHIKEMMYPLEIKACFPVFKELRPHLTNDTEFTSKILCQIKEGYKIIAGIINDDIAGCIGYRIMNTLAWGKILYIDDLISGNKFRNDGCGRQLLEYAINNAKELDCNQVHLDTGYSRHDAHRLYLKQGFQITSHHLSMVLDKQ